MAASPATKPGPGRPRDPRTDEVILDSVRAILTEQSYSRLSIDAVARRAGVTRPTVYRRWPSKAHLVHEAVYPAREVHFDALGTGDFSTDVRRFVDASLASFQRPETAAAVPGLLAEYRDHPALKELLAVRLEPVREVFRTLVRLGVGRGQVRADVDPDLLFETLNGAVMYAVLGTGMDERPGFAQELTDLVVRGARTDAPQPTADQLS